MLIASFGIVAIQSHDKNYFWFLSLLFYHKSVAASFRGKRYARGPPNRPELARWELPVEMPVKIYLVRMKL